MIFQDYKRNTGNVKGQIIMIAFRLCGIAKFNFVCFVLMLPYLIFYRLLIEWFLGVELPWKTSVGRGLSLHHGQSLVINDDTVLGDNCTIRHCTTIGHKKLINGSYSKAPRIGHNVDIGSNVCIIGEITIGDNVTIGAGSVVVKDVPSNCTVVGNPGRIINIL